MTAGQETGLGQKMLGSFGLTKDEYRRQKRERRKRRKEHDTAMAQRLHSPESP